ncbi:MAG: hypothetical protein EVA89_17215 [Sandaracinaceae bacterium]|nr:MAG: hypothetical protein EVA89_17215 [Sandaracinaceae bacterium]
MRSRSLRRRIRLSVALSLVGPALVGPALVGPALVGPALVAPALVALSYFAVSPAALAQDEGDDDSTTDVGNGPQRAVNEVVDGAGPVLSGLSVPILQPIPAWNIRLEGVGRYAWDRGEVGGEAHFGATFVRLGTPATDLRLLRMRFLFGPGEPGPAFEATLLDLTQYLCLRLEGRNPIGLGPGCPVEDAAPGDICAAGQWAAWRIRALTFVTRPSTGDVASELLRIGFMAAPTASGRTPHVRSEAITVEASASLDWSSALREAFFRGHVLARAVLSTRDHRARMSLIGEATGFVRTDGSIGAAIEAELRTTLFWFAPHEGVGGVYLAVRASATTAPDISVTSLFDGWVRDGSATLALGFDTYPYRGSLHLPEQEEY